MLIPADRLFLHQNSCLPADRPPSFIASPRFNGSSEPARSAEEIAIKTLKKGKVRCIASVLDVDGLQQRTAKD